MKVSHVHVQHKPVTLAIFMTLPILQNCLNLINSNMLDFFVVIFVVGIWQNPPLHACMLAKLDRKTDRESVGNLHKHDMLRLHISVEAIRKYLSQKYFKLFKSILYKGNLHKHDTFHLHISIRFNSIQKCSMLFKGEPKVSKVNYKYDILSSCPPNGISLK